MKSNKLAILMIAAVAIGMFALPATFSLGGEQHRFKTVESAATVDAFCESCHLPGTGDAIQTQLDNSGKNAIYGTAGVSTIHSTQSCGTCHGVTGGYANAGTPTNAAGTHAAELPSCLKCHGAGSSGYAVNNVVPELANVQEAHKNFNFVGDDDLQCIGCHTYVAKDGAPSYTFDRAAQQFNGGLTIGSGLNS